MKHPFQPPPAISQSIDKRKAEEAHVAVTEISASPGFESSSPIRGIDGYSVTAQQCESPLANYDKRRKLVDEEAAAAALDATVFRVPQQVEAPS